MSLSLFSLRKPASTALKASPAEVKVTYEQKPDQVGLLVTTQLEKALEECKAKVERIAKECRTGNRRFRDTGFDLENDRERCLHGVSIGDERRESYNPSDVQRVTRIFDKPQFFIDGAGSNDIKQGRLGDCWFLSALSTMTTREGLIEAFCVARDEEIGVYGFIFFRDTAWVTVVIDDLVFTSIPKYDELNDNEKILYHYDRDKYNESARKGGKGLYFAKSGTQGETWVPLLEKAYAKLHGSYLALCGGYASEAIEDLTGGVSITFHTKDILSPDHFWTHELLKANSDRLFGCYIRPLDTTRSGAMGVVWVNGLVPNHAYSVLRAVEVHGKRFVIVRNPWGMSEWTGRWSDGSKEWTKEWLDRLPELGHEFGDDGKFVMEYSDFLETWELIDRTLLFDSKWAMSSQWLQVTTRPLPSVYSYGDVSYMFTLAESCSTMIVLSQLDKRYWDPISGIYWWTAEFVVFKKGEKHPVARSIPSRLGVRSVNCEVDLDAGEYVVHVRLDKSYQVNDKDYYKTKTTVWDERLLSRVLNERAISRSIATNFDAEIEDVNLQIPLSTLAGQTLCELDQKAKKMEEEAKLKKDDKSDSGRDGKTKNEPEKKESELQEPEKKPESVTVQITSTVEKEIAQQDADRSSERATEEVFTSVRHPDGTVTTTRTITERTYPPIDTEPLNQDVLSVPLTSIEKAKDSDALGAESTEKENNTIFLGLKVYTNKTLPVKITGQLRQKTKITSELAL